MPTSKHSILWKIAFLIAFAASGIHYDNAGAAENSSKAVAVGTEKQLFTDDPRGGNGAWDKDLLFPDSRIVTLDNKHWIYYGGCSERHGTPGVSLPQRDPGIGLAWLRLDGFVSLTAGEVEGTVVTKPFRLEGRGLQVNIDARGGEAKVGVLDADGKPIAGYTLDEAWGYRGIDELRLEPRWKDQRDLQSLQGRDIRLQFQLRKASLYSFQVR